jgi:hypothetical protein
MTWGILSFIRRTILMKAPSLRSVFLIRESEEDDPRKKVFKGASPANPFDPPAAVKSPHGPNNPAAGLYQKPQTKVAPPSDPEKAAKYAPDKRKVGITKPPYRGTFVGQVFRSNDRIVHKNVSWKDRETGDPRYGKVPSQTTTDLVWNGDDWVTKADFDLHSGPIKQDPEKYSGTQLPSRGGARAPYEPPKERPKAKDDDVPAWWSSYRGAKRMK